MTELTEAFISWVFLNYRGTDEFWAAYQKFQNDPYLVVYVPLSRAEVQEVFREGGEISAVCSDPISAVPLDVDEEDA